MQYGVLIKTGDHCMAKAVFAGTYDGCYAEYLRIKEKFSGFCVEWYEDDTDPDFANAQVDMPGMIEEI